jgi:DNA topoisomerase I
VPQSRSQPFPIEDPASAAALSATEAGLVYVSDSSAGIHRLRDASGFSYVFSDRRQVTDSAELERIARLAIPPAYENVWICKDPRGHLQATGRDARGRKQYRYHPKWRIARDGSKHGRMLSFAEALPRLRRQISRDLAQDGLPRDKVLALVVSLLDKTRVRIGNTEYARANSSFGLTTLRNRHMRLVSKGRLTLKFRGKGGVDMEVPVDDPQLARLVRRCHQLPGQHLFQYADDEGTHHPIDSEQVNDYLRRAMRQDFTAKDFRTWGATLRAIIILRSMPLPERGSERALSGSITEAVKLVAADLRNTPAVCRKSYINPEVFEAWRNGDLHALITERLPSDLRRAERPAVHFLRQYAGRKRGARTHLRAA